MFSFNKVRKKLISLCCTSLLLAALLINSLIPPGFMPSGSAADGEFFSLEICTGYGAISLAADAPADHDDDSPHKLPCPFAVAALALAPQSDIASLLFVLPSSLVHLTMPASYPAKVVLHKAAPPRAPPSIA